MEKFKKIVRKLEQSKLMKKWESCEKIVNDDKKKIETNCEKIKKI